MYSAFVTLFFYLCTECVCFYFERCYHWLQVVMLEERPLHKHCLGCLYCVLATSVSNKAKSQSSSSCDWSRVTCVCPHSVFILRRHIDYPLISVSWFTWTAVVELLTWLSSINVRRVGTKGIMSQFPTHESLQAKVTSLNRAEENWVIWTKEKSFTERNKRPADIWLMICQLTNLIIETVSTDLCF